MNEYTLAEEIREGLQAIPLFDGHTHLTPGKLGARGAHDIVLYHMVISDLYAAGCPSGARLTEFPGWPSTEEAHARMREAVPYLPLIRNTSCAWGMRIILRDLYGWTEPVTAENWERLDGLVRERADDTAWQRQVARDAGIRKFSTELARRDPQRRDDALFDYSMEWAFFTRTQRGEFDTGLYELERCWGKAPGSPIPHGAQGRPAPERTIRTLDDVHAAMAHYVRELTASPVTSLATHISTDIRFRPVSDAEMTAALSRRAQAGPQERDIYAAYIHDAFLTALAPQADRIAFHASYCAEPMPHETASFAPQQALAEFADVAARHPAIRFVVFVSSRHANQTLCSMCREVPNIALAGYWWHNFFPGAMRQVMEERLDMLSLNKQVGFFSDAYCLEWAYAKAAMVRAQLAQVLAQKVRQGQYTVADALEIARAICYETPQTLWGMRPAEELLHGAG